MSDAHILQVFGVFMLACGLGFLLRPHYYGRLLEEFERTTGVTFLSGLIAVALGYVMVLTHNVWSGGAWVIVVTLLGWASFIKGFFLLVLPDVMISMMKMLKLRPRAIPVIGGIIAVVGAVLVYGGNTL